MVADQDFPSEHDQDYALALIQGRIAEKRLFEARFLCRRLGDGLGAERRQSLARKLDEALAQVEPLRRRAQALVAEGDHVQAGLVFSQIEAIAVDVPGVAEERRALAGAEALAARLHKLPVEEPEPVVEPIVEVVPAEPEHAGGESAAPVAGPIESPAASPAAQVSVPPASRPAVCPAWMLLAAGGLALGSLALGFLLWNKPSSPPPVAATSTIVIQPLQPIATAVAPVAPPAPEPAPPPVVEVPAPPVPPASTPSEPAVYLGSLQIKSDKKTKR